MLVALRSLYEGDAAPVPETPVAATPTPAGAPSRRRRYVVRVDGRDIVAETEQEALDLLRLAAEAAEEAAQAVKAAAIAKAQPALRKGKPITPPRIAVPTVDLDGASAALAAEAARVRAQIERLYAEAALQAEIALLLDARMREEDDEEALIALGMI